MPDVATAAAPTTAELTNLRRFIVYLSTHDIEVIEVRCVRATATTPPALPSHEDFFFPLELQRRLSRETLYLLHQLRTFLARRVQHQHVIVFGIAR